MPSARLHSKLTGNDVGSVVRWTAVDAAARLALSLTADDNGAIAKQTDDTSYWVLADYSVPTWVQLGNSLATTSSASDPTVDDDELSGYDVGQLWVNTTDDSAFILMDKTAGAAVWVNFTAAGVQVISGSGAPGVSTGNGLGLGSIYVDTTADLPYFLVDATTDANVWWSGVANQNLVSVMTTGSIDNVIVFTTDPLRLEDNSNTILPLTVQKKQTDSGTGSNNPVMQVVQDGLTDPGAIFVDDEFSPTSQITINPRWVLGEPGGAFYTFGARANASGNGSPVFFAAGGGVGATFSGADTTLLGGSGSTGADAGDAIVDGGSAIGGGANGALLLGTSNATAITIGQASTTTTVDGPLRLPAASHLVFGERASAPSTVAGEGALWVENGVTQSLQFTNDAGADRTVPLWASAPANNAILTSLGTTGEVDSTSLFTYGAGQLFIDAADASLRLKENATAVTTAAGSGAFYVKNDVPCAPRFVDDATTEFHLLTHAITAPVGAIPIIDSANKGKLQGYATLKYAVAGGYLELSSGAADFRLKERASAPSPAATFGAYWIKDSAPSAAMFTGDTGGSLYIASARQSLTLGAAATTFAITSAFMEITGDTGANTIATITGASSGQQLVLQFVDALVTITDDNTHAADSIDLSASFTSADDTTLTLIYDGTSWYEMARSVN